VEQEILRVAVSLVVHCCTVNTSTAGPQYNRGYIHGTIYCIRGHYISVGALPIAK